MRVLALLAWVLALDCVASSCSRLQPLSEQCGSSMTLVSPGDQGLEVIERPAHVLWWDESRPLWALQGRVNTSTASPVVASFLADLRTCNADRADGPTGADSQMSLALYRQPRRCEVTGQARTQVPYAQHAVGLSTWFCVAAGPKATVIDGREIRDPRLFSDDPILGVTKAGPDGCIFIQPGAYAVDDGRGITLSVLGPPTLTPADIGGREPWHRIDSERGSFVRAARQAVAVEVPRGASFVSGLDPPILLAISSGGLQLVRIPDVPRDGDKAIVRPLPIPDYSFRSIVASAALDGLVYALAEVESLATVPDRRESGDRLMAWVEVELGQAGEPSVHVRMHVMVRDDSERFVWLENNGSIYLAMTVAGRLGFANLRDGFCWVEGLDQAVEAVAATEQDQLLISGMAADGRRSGSIFREVEVRSEDAVGH